MSKRKRLTANRLPSRFSTFSRREMLFLRAKGKRGIAGRQFKAGTLLLVPAASLIPISTAAAAIGAASSAPFVLGGIKSASKQKKRFNKLIKSNLDNINKTKTLKSLSLSKKKQLATERAMRQFLK